MSERRAPSRCSLGLTGWGFQLALCVAALACGPASRGRVDDAPWRVVSIPDFLNADTRFPEPGWEDALSFVLDAIARERPDFVLVPGDLVMGHWLPGGDEVANWAGLYYPAWKERMRAHGLTFYTALGDHEVGDDPWPPWKARLVPAFKAAFREHLEMPRNGPPDMQGTAFWFVHKDVLFVAVDVFEDDGHGGIAIRVSGAQLEWLDAVLRRHGDARHVVVMGHTPVLAPDRRWTTSALLVEGGADSALWKLMARHGVDLYLAGEFHDVTNHRRDGIQQVVHGGLFGHNDRVNYLLLTFTPDRIELELKALDVEPAGERLWQPASSRIARPSRRLQLAPEVRAEGFRTLGTLVVDKTGGAKRFLDETGIFTAEANTNERIRNDSAQHWLRQKAAAEAREAGAPAP